MDPNDPFYTFDRRDLGSDLATPYRPLWLSDEPAQIPGVGSGVAGGGAEESGRTFFCTVSEDNEVLFSAGALNNFVLDAGEITGVANNHLVYLEATVSAGTAEVTALEVLSAAAVPADTSTKARMVLAKVKIVSGARKVTPLSWNWAQLQRCGTFLWGGFGY